MAKKKTQKSLDRWTGQKWRTKSGKPSTQGPEATGEPYLPSSAYKAMKKRTYAAAKKAKRKATKEGRQHARHGLHKGKKR